jgi:folate-binding protein YgfZ
MGQVQDETAGAHWSPGDADGYRALHEGLAVIELGRDVVRVSGPDAERYLQGQLSQDIAQLSPGASAWSLVLQPQGKLDALVRCTRLGGEEFLLDTDTGTGPALVARLLRFRLRTKADVEPLEWRALAVRGPAATLPAASLLAPSLPAAIAPGAGGDIVAIPTGAAADAIAVPFAWHTLAGYDLLGPRPTAPAEAVALSFEAYEAARIEAGFPVHGAELDERTIPAEAGLVEACVSFTKGCYTGQELVARIDSRGSNVPRHLRGLVLSGPARPGDRLYRLPGGPGAGPPDGGPPKEVGRVTSVARSPRWGWVALGYVGRAVEIDSTVAVKSAPGAAVESGREADDRGREADDSGDRSEAETTGHVHSLPLPERGR